MKNLQKIFLILTLILFIGTTNSALAKGRASNYEKTELANRNIQYSNSHFNNVCRKIIDNFGDDYQFKNNFAQISNLYIRMRDVELKMVYRSVDNKIPDYNYYYPTLSSQYLIELNQQELDRYQKAIIKYCVYGKYYQKDMYACSAERINYLFK